MCNVQCGGSSSSRRGRAAEPAPLGCSLPSAPWHARLLGLQGRPAQAPAQSRSTAQQQTISPRALPQPQTTSAHTLPMPKQFFACPHNFFVFSCSTQPGCSTMHQTSPASIQSRSSARSSHIHLLAHQTRQAACSLSTRELGSPSSSPPTPASHHCTSVLSLLQPMARSTQAVPGAAIALALAYATHSLHPPRAHTTGLHSGQTDSQEYSSTSGQHLMQLPSTVPSDQHPQTSTLRPAPPAIRPSGHLRPGSQCTGHRQR